MPAPVRSPACGRGKAVGTASGQNRAVLLQVRHLHVEFDLGRETLFGPRRQLQAVTGVDFDLSAGETLAVVGESGCGKSTLARAVLGLMPASGSVRLDGQELLGLSEHDMRPHRRDLQIIFQDPLASLDPRMTVAQIVAEPLRALLPELSAAQRRSRITTVLERVGLSRGQLNRYPHEFSGGQAQRIGIARALVVQPRMLVCDEPTSALDVSIKAQVINLLRELQQEMGLSLLFITHDLATVRHLADRVLVLYLGRVMEVADTVTLFANPRHPYTRALLAAIPRGERRNTPTPTPLAGEPPSPVDVPSGCVFRTRCPWAIDRCQHEVPALRDVGRARVACHRAEESAALHRD
ncbi:MAG TPA: oligopeptide/dipeptide ABC transporter ATP-binding protein [Nevskiaceae bacterium]|nr:oligopeptide/dipeptide ABC transporter ATP-binding protein [Nevskiaceae bacterium]